MWTKRKRVNINMDKVKKFKTVPNRNDLKYLTSNSLTQLEK